ncbi:redoxin domain-containing protein [Sporosarcina sp. Marseille-Q4063]|uniref:redoxin family protein n=1 Tax=Sporosarcina sp. Marseille-Q4063 TaxID=2810514 RepID=UPI001BB0663F|nr:redoxin domain-containing protein [Sporosarcina sp. Marseille-Q4063]QUW23122.1 redoxin domain-containing protein [Sporosarcina sp. Marseille-Q4063]
MRWLVSLIFIALLSGCGTPYGDVIHINIDDLAPEFVLEDLDGDTVALKDSGQKVYVKYWASWCSICLAGLEELDSLAANETAFRVISIVNPGYKGEMSSEEFKEWYATLPYENITVLLDEDGVWAKEFGVIAYPTSYFISSYGELEETIIGHTSNKEISKIMKRLR